MKSTSIEAYSLLEMSGKKETKAAQVYAYLYRQDEPKTRQQISKATGMSINCVCGRVNELVKVGLLREHSRVNCPVTGSSAHTLSVAA